MRKPMLSVDDLITHMQDKGILFKIISESDAKQYLHKNNNYFKLTSYRKNYPKFTTGKNNGKYEHLDFAYLIELARIDVQLRHIILNMCLDIEHFLKVELIKAIEQDPNEDGYSIILEYIFDSNNNIFSKRASNVAPRASSIANKLASNIKNPYCCGLIEKYNDEMPVWAFIEIISFGDLLRFIEYVATKINWNVPVDMKTLDRVRQIRNAAAHNNCIINDLRPTFDDNGNLKWNEPVYITNFIRKAGVKKSTMQKKLSNRRFSQIVHLLYAYDKIVTSSNSRNLRLSELNDLVNNRMTENKSYFKSNQLLISTYDIFLKLVSQMT